MMRRANIESLPLLRMLSTGLQVAVGKVHAPASVVRLEPAVPIVDAGCQLEYLFDQSLGDTDTPGMDVVQPEAPGGGETLPRRTHLPAQLSGLHVVIIDFRCGEPARGH